VRSNNNRLETVERGSPQPPTLAWRLVSEIRLGVVLTVDDTDDEHLDELTRLLCDELREADVRSVDRIAGGVTPPSAKGLGLSEIGSLIVTLLNAGALTQVVDTIRSWLDRDKGRSAELTLGADRIKLTGLSAADQRALIEAWIARAGTEVERPGG
jgi:hypothetical protein